MFERGEIRTQTAAGNLIKLIQENKMEQVDAKLGKLQGAVAKKADKRKASEMERDANYETQERERQPNTLSRLKTGAASYQRSS